MHSPLKANYHCPWRMDFYKVCLSHWSAEWYFLGPQMVTYYTVFRYLLLYKWRLSRQFNTRQSCKKMQNMLSGFINQYYSLSLRNSYGLSEIASDENTNERSKRGAINHSFPFIVSCILALSSFLSMI